MNYLSEQADGQLEIINKREKIDTILKNEKVSEEIKEKLRLVLDVRGVIEKELSLKVYDNYSTYVDLKRAWVIKVLSVSEKCEIKPFEWSFPVVGSVPYLGFFKEQSAIRKEKEFKAKGYDTIISDVPAFSTLGWFSDPVLSSFISYNDFYIISTIIHETVHVNIFQKGDMTFNENIASFIEEEGTKLYLEKKYGKDSSKYIEYQSYIAKEALKINYLKKVIYELEVFYSRGVDCTKIKKQRKEKFRAYEKEFMEQFGYKVKINNAFLVYIKLYNIQKDHFQKELKEKFDDNLKLFIESYKGAK